jgi:hypothetical protein
VSSQQTNVVGNALANDRVGGYSYFSPQYGFVCDNVLEYTIVLANGDIQVVSESQNHRLWRALKGGANNFGIVTSFRFRTLRCTKVWSGFLYMFSWKAPQVLRAFHDFVGGCCDESAGGPLLCMSYVQQIGMTIISTHLMYTKAEAWPKCWETFKSIGRIWSSTKVRTLTETTDELDGISPAGFRCVHTKRFPLIVYIDEETDNSTPQPLSRTTWQQ